MWIVGDGVVYKKGLWSGIERVRRVESGWVDRWKVRGIVGRGLIRVKVRVSRFGGGFFFARLLEGVRNWGIVCWVGLGVGVGGLDLIVEYY